MPKQTKSFPDTGGKYYYKSPYPGHRAMCSDRSSEIKNPSVLVGPKKVTEGRKPHLLDSKKGSNPSHGERGYKSAKKYHK